jgi:hypothetical protein
MLSGHRAFVSTTLQSTADSKARQALERIVAELGNAGIDNLTADPSGPNGDDEVAFLPLVNVVNGVAVLGNEVRIRRQASPTDPNDGVDNDGNGLVDEGELVLTRNVGAVNESSTVLCTEVPELLAGEKPNGLDDNGNGVVDESGFNVQRQGSLLAIRIGVVQPGAGGTSAEASVTTSVTLRN